MHREDIVFCNRSEIASTLCLLLCLIVPWLHCTALYCTALQCTALNSTTLNCIALHSRALHCTALHFTVLVYWTVLHCMCPVCLLDMPLDCTAVVGVSYSTLFWWLNTHRGLTGEPHLYIQSPSQYHTDGKGFLQSLLLFHFKDLRQHKMYD